MASRGYALFYRCCGLPWSTFDVYARANGGKNENIWLFCNFIFGCFCFFFSSVHVTFEVLKRFEQPKCYLRCRISIPLRYTWIHSLRSRQLLTPINSIPGSLSSSTHFHSTHTPIIRTPSRAFSDRMPWLTTKPKEPTGQRLNSLTTPPVFACAAQVC